MIAPPPFHLFCASASKDEALFDRLHSILGVLIQQEIITIWHYKQLLPGTKWDQEIVYQLSAADVILLLISPDFINSDYCYRKEMRWALDRQARGGACVVPILLRATPGWEQTPLGELQALPKNLKPVTEWRRQEDAFAQIARELLGLIHHLQQEERYPIHEYILGLKPSVYEGEAGTAAQDCARSMAERWIEEVSGHIGGTLQETGRDDHQQDWGFTYQHQQCAIRLCWNYRGMDRLGRYFRSADLTLASQDLTLLERMIAGGTLPYGYLQWSLEDLDVVAFAQILYEQLGKRHTSAVGTDAGYHLEYTLYASNDAPIAEHLIRATLTAKTTTSPARVCIIHDNVPLRGFYQAHRLFSVQKVLAILKGDPRYSYQHIRQLVEDACTPYES